MKAENKIRYVVIDVETTGLSPVRGDRIIEIGAVAIESSQITGEFMELVNPQKYVTKGARMIHRITDEMLAGRPGPEEILPRFHKFIGTSQLVAHNAAFDITFLHREFARLGLSLNNRTICTLKMSRRHFPYLPNHKLETVYKHLCGDLPYNVHRHRALDDARLTARVWMEMGRI